MTTTIMKSDLILWLDLFVRDPELRPLGLTNDGEHWWLESPHKNGRDYLGTSAPDVPIQDEHAELLIIAKAIRWFNTKHEGLEIGDGSWDEEYPHPWPSGFSVRVYDPYFEAMRSDDRLVDALYKVAIAALDNQDVAAFETRRQKSWWGRFKKRFFNFPAFWPESLSKDN